MNSYEVLKLLGWINIILASTQVSMYIVRRINKHLFKNKSETLKRSAKLLKKIHPYMGGMLAVTATIHGYMLLGGFRLHSGYFAWLIILAVVFFGWAGPRYKMKNWLKIHRALVLVLVGAVLFHVLKMKSLLFQYPYYFSARKSRANCTCRAVPNLSISSSILYFS
ncbi:hypothetical protein EAL2_808p02840 (plasmid) [Peptoclostridium acidaminophilum DSM 3953]|uniref:Ferric oxidoreductase domain-containing protein n=1 Tax=Peptoclostridium acidaminophilum DSM 3953 TaxID=1286171 RepID=W8T7S9_PEPAC|nr:hypothetical protein EAL2_808p02840 [Peptoclostridium acidaminophilum DSM 3953]